MEYNLNGIEIFDDDYTKKINLLAKIATASNTLGSKNYILQSHGEYFVLRLDEYQNGFMSKAELSFEAYKCEDIYKEISKITKDGASFFIPNEKVLEKVYENPKTLIPGEFYSTFKQLKISSEYGVLEGVEFKAVDYIDFMTAFGKEVTSNEPFDYINAFLRNTKNINALGMNERRPRFEFADGTTISIQADQFLYCSPRSSTAEHYDSVECGFPSKKIRRLKEYAEDPRDLKNTVYPYTPVSVLNEIAQEKGISENMKRIINGEKSIEK